MGNTAIDVLALLRPTAFRRGHVNGQLEEDYEKNNDGFVTGVIICYILIYRTFCFVKRLSQKLLLREFFPA
jgi:hypothetical protein